MVKSVGRKGVTLWYFDWQVEEQIKSDNEERRSREIERGREAWREVVNVGGRRVGNQKKKLEIQKKTYE